ncbi:MAG: Ig-like domain-containing protein, partial [Desulfuromonadales bacterium]|nr:Ig-like domain-containing protein [Desulfuromonadales bacterium]
MADQTTPKQAMTETAGENTTMTGASLTLPAPTPGQTQSMPMDGAQIVEVPYDISEQTLVLDGDDLRIEWEDGAVLVLEDFAALAEQGEAPLLMLADGTMVPGDALLTALTETPEETAAGEAGADSGGSGEYRGDMGDILNGLNKLGVQDPDPFGAAAAQAPEDEQTRLPENQPPIAEDNTYFVTEGQVQTFGQLNGQDLGILNNDFDPDGDPVSIVFADAPSNIVVNTENGSVTVNANGAGELSAVYDALDEGETIEVTFPYTITDPEGATATANVIIIVEGENDPPELDLDDGDGIVYEAGLPNGSGIGPTEIHADGVFTISDPDGLDDISSITLGNKVMTIGDGPGEFASLSEMVGESFNAAFGAVELTGYSGGIFTYRYTLTSPTFDVPGETETDNFNIEVSDGDTTLTAEASVEIVDDIPDADPDFNSVTEGGSVSGNVLGNDILGADGPTPGGAVVGVAAGNDPSSPVSGQTGSSIAGTYGTLTLNADGSYSYESTPNAVNGNAQDVFVYTIQDGDNDLSTTTLTINLGDGGFTTNSSTVTVNEAALDQTPLPDGSDLAVGTVTGSLPGSSAETASNSLTTNGGSAPLSFALVGSAVGSYGVIQLNSNGGYTYTLTSPVDGPTADDGTNTINGAESFTYTVTDANGNSANATINISIVDDIPSATAEAPQDVAEGATTTGQLDFVAGADGAAISHIDGTPLVFDPQDDDYSQEVDIGDGMLKVKADGSY